MTQKRLEIPKLLHLRICLKQLFHQQNPDDVINIVNCKEHIVSDDVFSLLSAGLKANSVGLGYTYDQCELIAIWFIESYKDLYSAINKFAEILKIDDDKFVVNIENILRWHGLSQYLTEDLLVCTKLAFNNKHYLGNFSWSPFIAIDDKNLNTLLRKPLSDVHAHLKGSSLNFEVNWLCLMNHISHRSAEFTELESWRQHKYCTNYFSKQYSLYEKAIMAAAIRLVLYGKAKEMIVIDDKLARHAIHSNGLLDSISISMEIQKAIDISCVLYGRKYLNSTSQTRFCPDYANDEKFVAQDEVCAYSILSGERFIMYSTLSKLKGETMLGSEYGSLFYLYLLIKNEIRNELVQVNEAVGFDNFNQYERHKTLFIENYHNYEQLLVHLSVASFFDGNEKGRKHETRIAPKTDYNKFLSSLLQIESDVINPIFGKEKKSWQYGYVYHFIKRFDNTAQSLKPLYERHHELREDVKYQANNIARLVQSNSVGMYGHISSKILGIDAANSEILTRPEVYAQAFRYLRNLRCYSPDNKQLGITYHVGEDFIDVVDGLRALDELLLFMNYKKGDRLGHALVLGVNVNEYYRSRSFTICMTKQMLLDNVAWLYHKCRVLGGYKKTQRLLLEKFKEHIKYVYDQEPDIDTYYCAWLLRGDNPNMYKFDGDVKPLDLGEWNEASLNSSFNHLRKSKAVCKLYYLYQYDADVKLKGNKMTNFIIDEKGELLDAIIFIQTAMRKKVQNMGIAIECNPTSNFKIGEIERYDEHPICLFYDFRKDKRYSHISSSINTDDKGIFSTSIEREYALIYAAFKRKISLQRSLLCKEFDIVKWLDEIREHSNQQCFLK